MSSADDEYRRLTALGTQLIETHARLLDAIDDLRDGTVPVRDLTTHCLAFCAALTGHHTEEDADVFPMLAARHPELREVLDGLKRDHEVMAGMLDRVAAGVPGELDGLAALLESHFAWEERRLVAVLNGISR
jgi:hypothetical protein